MSNDKYAKELARLQANHKLRTLTRARGLDFASNDYLGLAHHPALKLAIVDALDNGVAVGAGASRLLRGNHEPHEDLEAFAAKFFGVEAVLFMNNGYSANFAIFTTLTGADDAIFYDELSHASTREGIYAAKAQHFEIRHNDAQAFEHALKTWRHTHTKGQAWLAVESLYSMDGDTAPLEALAKTAKRHNAMLVIDEAHATGVHGPGGKGFAHSLNAHDNHIIIHTCGKAMGAQGALICSTGNIKDYFINKCRPLIFSTAPSPLMAIAVKTALGLIASEPERRTALKELYTMAHDRLAHFTNMPGTPTQILPIIIGGDQRALELAGALQAKGFDVRAIRPPTVAQNTARLRLSITLNVEQPDVIRLIDNLEEILSDRLVLDAMPQ